MSALSFLFLEPVQICLHMINETGETDFVLADDFFLSTGKDIEDSLVN